MPPPAQYAAAYPRKRFFIEMFTRDIALEDCILDLIDNSIDSLIRTRSLNLTADVAANKKIRSKAHISVELSGAKISISDNCGGIPITKVRDEIFNFGHSEAGANKLTKRGLGAYGIGLKRAIFKMGRKFRLDSSHDDSSFRVEQDIDEWVRKDDDIQDWRFPLSPKALDELDCCKNGTAINISKLYSSIHGLASNDAFVDSLCRAIARTYSFFLSRYARVEVNGKEIEPVPMPVGDSADGYEPAVERYHDDDVDVYIKAGLAARGTRGEWQADRAGWYVLCNGRIVVSADKTQLTGWGAGILPTFHSSKARGFVGIANFTLEANPLKLPWTTTKRGLDRESGVFLRARNKMQSVARPVYSYLESHYPTGDDATSEERDASKSVSQASTQAMMSSKRGQFKPPRRRTKTEKVSVQFSVARSKLELVREHLDRPNMSAGEMGEHVFNYFLDQEEIEVSALSESYKKVRYDLRPAKQVERLMLLDAFRRLTYGGFQIHNYQYTGMGSVHFYDFSLFHKFAGIDRMISAEMSKKIARRVRFNKPFRSIKVRMEPVGNVIPSLSQSMKHLLWLDYDSTIKDAYLADTTQAIATLTPGSLLLVTVDVESPGGLERPALVRDEYISQLGELLPWNLKPARFTPKNLPALNADLLWRAVTRGLSGRDIISFQPLFKFLYQDGHRMLTVGGMVVDKEAKIRLNRSGIFDAPYIRRAFDRKPHIITVPVLTRKERILMDGAMPCRKGWRPRQFELPARDVEAYRNIYQYAPNFGELIF